jgi:hypothetical protein
MTAMSHLKISLLVFMVLPVLVLAAGCAGKQDFNEQVKTITKPYRFDLVEWEIETLAGEFGGLFTRHNESSENETAQVIEYFDNITQIKDLEAASKAIRAGTRSGDLAKLQQKIDELKQQNAALSGNVTRELEDQVSETLSQQGIYNPIYRYTGLKAGFPPVNIYLADPPHLLVVSPRDRIATIKKVFLLPEMSLEAMEEIEDEVDKLGVSSLVVGFGGLSTYPSYVNDKLSLDYIINTIAHEWVHQYLVFTPLGFQYILDQIGIRPDYDIATINETVANIVGQEIGAITYKKYYPTKPAAGLPPEASETGFDFNKEMREIRKAVDDYLARGQIDEAEEFMKQKRQYLEDNGYYIRKLNQAYFAFHGTYADSPTSINPIGPELKELRGKSASLKDFVDTVSTMTSREDLAESLK